MADKKLVPLPVLDKRNQFIADEGQQTGTDDHTPVDPRGAVKRARPFAPSMNQTAAASD